MVPVDKIHLHKRPCIKRCHHYVVVVVVTLFSNIIHEQNTSNTNMTNKAYPGYYKQVLCWRPPKNALAYPAGGSYGYWWPGNKLNNHRINLVKPEYCGFIVWRLQSALLHQIVHRHLKPKSIFCWARVNQRWSLGKLQNRRIEFTVPFRGLLFWERLPEGWSI